MSPHASSTAAQAAPQTATVGKRQKVELPVEIKHGISMLDLEQIGTPLKQKVLKLEKQLEVELKKVADSEYAVGKTLCAIRDLLQPLKLFVLYLNRQPWMSVATAYRYIQVYERMQTDAILSPAVIEIAAAQNVPIFSSNKDRPYGKLTDAVQAMPKAPNDAKGATEWLFMLRSKAKEIRPDVKRMSPMDRLAKQVAHVYNKQLGTDALSYADFIGELARRAKALIVKVTPKAA